MMADTAHTDTPIALITGAAHGLGREVASQLADQGHRVVITARDPRAAQQAADELGERVQALPVALDIADSARA